MLFQWTPCVTSIIASIKRNCFHKKECRLLNFNNGFQQLKKSSEQKSILFSLDRKKFPLAGMKDSFKNMSSLDGKVSFGGSNIWKKWKEQFSLVRNLVYTLQAEIFAEEMFAVDWSETCKFRGTNSHDLAIYLKFCGIFPDDAQKGHKTK